MEWWRDYVQKKTPPVKMAKYDRDQVTAEVEKLKGLDAPTSWCAPF